MRIFKHKRKGTAYKVLYSNVKYKQGDHLYNLVVYKCLETGVRYARLDGEFFAKFDFDRHATETRKQRTVAKLMEEAKKIQERGLEIIKQIMELTHDSKR